MGEVYKARDTRLGREVAVKVLPQTLARDPDRIMRFEREARAASALSDPHIVAVYDVGREGETHFFVSELVEGSDLRSRLESGGVPAKKALELAEQIASGLAAAHEKGIVHRDLKPENVLITKSGLAKIADFGLAKLTESSEAGVSELPTSDGHQTTAGVVMGTISYMSPEQARGGAVDFRSDQFSFGSILYEMLTGKQAFKRGSPPETLSAIIREEPVPVAEISPGVAAPLAWLIERCLAKDPQERFVSTRDLARDVSGIRQHLSESTQASLTPVSLARRGRVSIRIAAVAAVAVIVGTLIGSRISSLGRPTTSPKPSFRFRKLTFLPGLEWAPELSADGKTLFFAAGDASESELYSVPIGGKKPTQLTSGPRSFNDSPRLSPDGSRLLFASSRDGGGLFLMGVNGESLRKLSEVGNAPAWSPDGRSVAFSTEEIFLPYDGIDGGKLGVIEVASGKSRNLKTHDAHQPTWSPSGRRIAYWGLPEGGGGNREIWTIGIDGGPPLVVASDPAVDWNPVWSEDGRHLYFLSDRGGAMNLWRVPIDEVSGRQLGEPESVPLPADEVIYLARSGKRWVYAAYSSRSQIQRLEFDPERSALVGAPRTVLSTTRSVRSIATSPDGKRLAFTTMRPQEDLYVVATEGATPTQLTDDPEFDRFPSWAPDGERIVFSSYRGEKFETWAIRPDGSGLQQLTRTKEDSGWSPIFSARADRLALSLAQGIGIFDATGPIPWGRFERIPPPAGAPGSNFTAVSWSASGDRLAGYVYRGNAPRRVAVLDLASSSYRLFDPPSRPVGWYPDGRRLLIDYRDALAILDVASWIASPVPNNPELRGRISASRDLRTIITLVDDQQADIWLAEELAAR